MKRDLYASLLKWKSSSRRKPLLLRGARQTGKTFLLKEFGRRSPVRFHEKNSDGWFRVDLRSGWVQRAEMMFIKPKEA